MQLSIPKRLPIIINIRSKWKTALLKTVAVRAAHGSQRVANVFTGPAADWFLDYHPMNFNQSGDFVDPTIIGVLCSVKAQCSSTNNIQ